MSVSLHSEVSNENLAHRNSESGKNIVEQLVVEKLLHENRRLTESVTKAVTEEAVAKVRLQKFASKVSHDLKAPLRHINAYLSIIREDCQQENFGEELLSHMETVTSASKKISSLIDAIRLVARVNEQENIPEKVHLQREFDLVIDQLNGRYPGITWEVSELPVVQTDLVMIRTIIHHLLDNAAKFSQTQEFPTIRVSVYREEEFHVIRIEDNGIGFDPRYRFKLFEIFEKLHSDINIPGSGVGLAIVDSLLDKLGGKIVGEGEEGKGAIFTMMLPS